MVFISNGKTTCLEKMKPWLFTPEALNTKRHQNTVRKTSEYPLSQIALQCDDCVTE